MQLPTGIGTESKINKLYQPLYNRIMMRLKVVTREPLIMYRRLSRLQLQQHLQLGLFTVKHFQSNYRWFSPTQRPLPLAPVSTIN